MPLTWYVHVCGDVHMPVGVVRGMVHVVRAVEVLCVVCAVV